MPTAPVVEGDNIGGADGVLGLDTLQDQRVLIDFKAQTMHVADGAPSGGNRGFEIIVRAHRKLGQLIITQARLDGVRVDVIVDTGAQGTTGNPALLRKLRANKMSVSAAMTDIDGVVVTGHGWLGSCRRPHAIAAISRWCSPIRPQSMRLA